MSKLFFLVFILIATNCYSSQKITVVTEDLAGFQMTDGNSKLVGPTADKVIDALNKANVDYEISVNAWSTSYNMALRDANTCIFSLARIPVREPQFTWIAPIASLNANFYALENNSLTIKNIDDAKNYKTVVIRNNFSHHYLKDNGFTELNHLLVIDNFPEVIQLMKRRKEHIDLIVLNELQLAHQYRIAPSTPKLKKVMAIDDADLALYFACNKQMSATITKRLYTAFQQ